MKAIIMGAKKSFSLTFFSCWTTLFVIYSRYSHQTLLSGFTMGLLKGTWGGVCYTITTTDCDCGTYLTHKPWTVIIVCQSVYRLESGLGHTLHNILWKLKQSFSLTFFSCWTTLLVIYSLYWGQTLLSGFTIGLLKGTWGGVCYTITTADCDCGTYLTRKPWTVIIVCKNVYRLESGLGYTLHNILWKQQLRKLKQSYSLTFFFC